MKASLRKNLNKDPHGKGRINYLNTARLGQVCGVQATHLKCIQIKRIRNVGMFCSPLMNHCTEVVPYWEKYKLVNKWEIRKIVTKNECSFCCFINIFRRSESGLEMTGPDAYGPPNPSCSCLTHSRGDFPQHGNQVFWVLQSELRKKLRQQRGHWLLVMNWILTGSTEQRCCRVSGGCAAMNVNTWVDIKQLQSILWSFAPISLVVETRQCWRPRREELWI